MFRVVLLMAVMFAATVVTAGANAATLSLVGSSTKICQLTGETDWATNAPTAAQTLSNFGMDGTDLGFPADTGTGPLYFLFGDTWPIRHPPASIPSVPPDDALGWSTRATPPDGRDCLDLHIATGERRTFAHPTVAPAIKQGLFNVPSGGIFLDDVFYAFFWTNHCAHPAALAPDPSAPLTVPGASGTCLETPEINSVGRSVLARATAASPLAFHQTMFADPAVMVPAITRMPSGFVYVTAANLPPLFAGRLEVRESRVPVFGAARYRASIPYLAMAPRATFGNPATWSFFAGRTDGHPVWITREQWESGHTASGAWAPPAGAEIYAATPGERCVGEHSVTWNAPLQSWLLLYNCGGAIKARVAAHPWGPWSPPTVILSAAHDRWVVCTLIMNASGCPGELRRNYWPKLANGNTVPGGFYAPFVLNRYTRGAESATQVRLATVTWLVSTWNPYNVAVMRSTLQLLD
jgi:Domain of unknown function (DUF4185)